MYRFKVGDKVRHEHHVEKVGVITELLTEEYGDPIKKRNPKNPWYHIKWKGGPLYKGDSSTIEYQKGFLGFEHDTALIPEEEKEYAKSILITQILYDKNKKLWNFCVKQADELIK